MGTNDFEALTPNYLLLLKTLALLPAGVFRVTDVYSRSQCVKFSIWLISSGHVG